MRGNFSTIKISIIMVLLTLVLLGHAMHLISVTDTEIPTIASQKQRSIRDVGAVIWPNMENMEPELHGSSRFRRDNNMETAIVRIEDFWRNFGKSGQQLEQVESRSSNSDVADDDTLTITSDQERRALTAEDPEANQEVVVAKTKPEFTILGARAANDGNSATNENVEYQPPQSMPYPVHMVSQQFVGTPNNLKNQGIYGVPSISSIPPQTLQKLMMNAKVSVPTSSLSFPPSVAYSTANRPGVTYPSLARPRLSQPTSPVVPANYQLGQSNYGYAINYANPYVRSGRSTLPHFTYPYVNGQGISR